MANRERTRSPSSSETPSSPDEAFDAGKTTLDLDDVSEEELESLYFEDEPEESNLFNLQTGTGLGLILAGVIYLLAAIGVWSAPLLGLGAALPLLVGVFVILVGFGVLTWRSSGDGETAARTTKKAVDAETGEPKVVEEPARKDKARLTRSRTDKKLLGVCGGLAEYLNLDPTLVRIAFVVGVIGSGGPFVLGYLGLAFIMPKESPLTPEEKLSIIRDEADSS